MGTPLPWSERVVMLSVNPDAGNRNDVARLAAERMAVWHAVVKAVRHEFNAAADRASKVAARVNDDLARTCGDDGEGRVE